MRVIVYFILNMACVSWFTLIILFKH